jgi:hypothetical protein
MDLKFLWVLLGLALILAGAIFFETGFAVALIPVGLSVMALGGG